MRLRLLLAACLTGLLSSACNASDLTVTAGNLRNDLGQVLICMFSADGSDKPEFPDCVKGHGVRSAQAPISGGKVVMTFNGLKDGVYAVAIVHDENGNGKMDTNFSEFQRKAWACPPIRGYSASQASSRGNSASKAIPPSQSKPSIFCERWQPELGITHERRRKFLERDRPSA